MKERFKDGKIYGPYILPEVKVTPSKQDKANLVARRVNQGINQAGKDFAIPFVLGAASLPTSPILGKVTTAVGNKVAEWLPRLSFTSTYGVKPATIIADGLSSAVSTGLSTNDLVNNGPDILNTTDLVTSLIPGINSLKNASTKPASIVKTKSALKPWRNKQGINQTTRFYIKGKPNQYFELVKDNKPGYYSVHFKTKQKGLSDFEKDELFRAMYNALPKGAKLSTYGDVSKGGFSGIARFRDQYGMVEQPELRTLGLKNPNDQTDIINQYQGIYNDDRHIDFPILKKEYEKSLLTPDERKIVREFQTNNDPNSDGLIPYINVDSEYTHLEPPKVSNKEFESLNNYKGTRFYEFTANSDNEQSYIKDFLKKTGRTNPSEEYINRLRQQYTDIKPHIDNLENVIQRSNSYKLDLVRHFDNPVQQGIMQPNRHLSFSLKQGIPGMGHNRVFLRTSGNQPTLPIENLGLSPIEHEILLSRKLKYNNKYIGPNRFGGKDYLSTIVENE